METYSMTFNNIVLLKTESQSEFAAGLIEFLKNNEKITLKSSFAKHNKILQIVIEPKDNV